MSNHNRISRARLASGADVRSSTLPLYVGGFIGPFGGAVLAVLIPQLRSDLDATTAEVAAAIPAYLIPFALLQLVSGTIGERLGRRRVVRAGYIAFALFSVLSAIAPSIELFIGARALQGASNAFLTPLLMAGLAEVVAPERLGRTIGTFAAVQTAAIAFSPLLGGLLGEVDWRLAFLLPAIASGALAFFPPAEGQKALDGQPARLRAVLVPRVAWLSGAAFLGYAGVTGLGFLVALEAADNFGLGSVERGVVVAGFGFAGMLLGRPAGGLVDRFGRIPVAFAGALACALTVGAIGFAHEVWVLAVLWVLAGFGSTLVWAGLNTMAVEAVPGNRAGATSVFSAFKFAGNAAAPIMWLPLYELDERYAFLGAAALALVVAVIAAFPLAGRGASGCPVRAA
jgi:MFS family permease